MRLHLIDGTFELFRAHYSRRPPRLSPSGQDVKGTVGVVSTLIRLVEDPYDDVTHLAVAFDNPVDSFRNRLYSGYKSGEGLDPAVLAQFDLVEDAVDALGIVVWAMDEFEADDALATGAARWRDEVDQVRILSPDKDLGQCIVDDNRLYSGYKDPARAVRPSCSSIRCGGASCLPTRTSVNASTTGTASCSSIRCGGALSRNGAMASTPRAFPIGWRSSAILRTAFPAFQVSGERPRPLCCNATAR